MKDRIYSYATKAWQCVLGCREDLACAPNCWAKRTVNRLACSPNEKVRTAHAGLVETIPAPLCSMPGDFEGERMAWTGTVRLNEAHLLDPLKWRQPQIVASGYHGDIGLLPPEDLDRIFAVAALCPQHQFLMLTKRPGRLVEYLARRDRHNEIELAADAILPGKGHPSFGGKHLLRDLPLPNVWLGCSPMTQADADRMLPWLMRLAAAGWQTWMSAEPCVGPMDVRPYLPREEYPDLRSITSAEELNARVVRTGLRWVVLGGESGSNARPMHPDWVRKVRDDCAAAGVPFWFKQWGAWQYSHKELPGAIADGITLWTHSDGTVMRRGGKDALALLDGQLIQQHPTELARIAEGRDAE